MQPAFVTHHVIGKCYEWYLYKRFTYRCVCAWDTRALITETFSTQGGKLIPLLSLRWQQQWKWLHSYRDAWKTTESVKVMDTQNKQEPDLDWKDAFIFNLPRTGDTLSVQPHLHLTCETCCWISAALMKSMYAAVKGPNLCSNEQEPTSKKLNI